MPAIVSYPIALSAFQGWRCNVTHVGLMRFAGNNPELLDLVKMLTSVDPIPAGQIWDQFYRPAQDSLIDPVSMAATYGTPASRKVVANTAAWEDGLQALPVDGGAAALDMLLRKVGIPSNLSGIANPPTVRYPISPDIHYKRQFKPVTGPAKKSSKQPGTIVEYLGFTDIPMMDWDVPSSSHLDRNVTVRNLGDVEELLRTYIANHPQSRINLYQTPGGFRAWETAERLNTSEFQPRFQELNVDPDYAMLSNTGFGRTVQGVPIDPPSFRARVSHKPGRTDWVAQPIATFTGADAVTPDPQAIALIKAFHDEPIRRRYLTMDGASPNAVAAVRRALPTASQDLQRQIRQRFSL